MENKLDWAGIKAFAFDIDGVLTDGGVLADNTGELYRIFGAKDSFAIRMAAMHGYHLGIITGGRSECIRRRSLTCGIPNEDIYLASRNKLKDFNDFCDRHFLDPCQVMYVGDDVPDIEVLKAAGIGVCPCDACDEVLAIADFISPYPGGKLCVRDAIRRVMLMHDTWNFDVNVYEQRF